MVTQLRVNNSPKRANPLCEPVSAGPREVVSEEIFKRMLAIERKRTERSKEPFLLMLLEAGRPEEIGKNGRVLDGVACALLSCTRETDVIGWYKDRTTVGVVYTGLPVNEKSTVLSTILNKVSSALRNELMCDQFDHISISFHFFPDDWDRGDSENLSDPALYPDLFSPGNSRRSGPVMKRVLDLAGSALLLILCAPLLVMIALAIKASSRGPMLFKQKRVGQYGQLFTFLKFRSMQNDNDHSIHKDFIAKLIADKAEHLPSNGSGERIYKLPNDKRVTPLGKFLRRTSLDELPQLLNVLAGDMSLVGPRPPIPYEVAAYQPWHRRRVLEVKPGITGLWQIDGRSRVKFDEMVRLDLRYAASWTLWLDLKILLKTPLAVIKGAGAY
jgi:lipopolysaccharide/colanic/teichoic acid biosynthesis glycosyltransferase